MNSMSEAETRSEGGEAAVYRKGAWSKEEDEKLKRAVEELGDRNWVRIERLSGLGRPAKNCRLRWFNYLRPNLKKYPFTPEEQHLIFHLHHQYGNAWSRIASKLPGRSDNDIKNFWHKKAKKRQREDLPISPTPLKHNKKQNLSQLNIHSPPQSTLQPTTFLSSPHQMPFSPLNLRLSVQDLLPTQPQLPSIQFNPPQTHQLESQSNLEIIDELRKAQARVRLLKKKLRQRGISNTKQSSRNEYLFINTPEETHLLTTEDENSSRMTENDSSRKDGIQESGECVQQESIENSESLEKGFEREEEVSIYEIFKMKNSETVPDHGNSPNWNLWDECSSTLLQELEGDLFGERDESGQLLSYGGEYFKCSWGQESSESNQGAAALECSNMVSQPTATHESMGSHHFSLQTQLCQSSFVQHQYHEAQHNEFYRGEETWKQDLEDNLWVEDEKFFVDRYDFTC